MDRDEALKLLRGGEDGVAEWNRWREKREELPDVSGAKLNAVTLNMHLEVWEAASRSRRGRDPAFRETVLRAYEHRCVVTGFRAALSGTFFGCEAAHVQWHAYDGPDVVENGMSMEPTIHKLFDAGAWSLTDDRRILVSADYTGSDTAIHRLREHHGAAIRSPISGEPPVSLKYIRWHRDPKLGGVFRTPALQL